MAPCFVCDNAGQFVHDGATHPCNCAYSRGVPSYLVPMNQSDTAPAGSPNSHPAATPFNPASTPIIPTSPSNTKNPATKALVMSVSSEGVQYGN